MSRKQARSPLRELPLRQPGQSIEEEIRKLDDKLVAYFFFLIGCSSAIVLAVIEHLSKKLMDPVFLTAFAVLVIAFSAIQIARIWRKMELLKLGRDGEKIVGQGLEKLRQEGCAIFHDIKGENFNLDHVIVSSHGIFVVETKTFSKPTKGKATVDYDGKEILVNGHVPDRDPLQQVDANVHWLRDILKESTGKDFPVKGVVVFPGWFVDSRKAKGSAIWVLNPKALAAFIPNEPETIRDSDVYLIAFHLSRYIRAVH